MTPSHFTLYLDSHQPETFVPANPHSDDVTFVPGSDSNGVSFTVPSLGNPIEIVKVIAAYVDATNTIVPPPASGQVHFWQTNTSALQGMAMNAPDSRGAEGPDHDFASEYVDFQGSTATTDLRVWDYGGFTIVHATHNSNDTQPMQLPRDANNNWIPDAGWSAGGQLVADDVFNQWEDADPHPQLIGSTPPSGGTVGDGLTRFEEYRGFVVRGDHTRTDPSKKDIFIASALKLVNTDILLGYSTNLPFVIHHVYGERDDPAKLEYFPATVGQEALYRAINANTNNAQTGGQQMQGHITQRAVMVWDGTVPQPNPPNGTVILANTFFPLFAPSYCTPSDGATPAELAEVTIDLQQHVSEGNLGMNTQQQIENEIRRTVAHELGHAIHVKHRGSPSVCDDGANVGSVTSAMDTGWWNGPSQTDPASSYDNLVDVPQMRLIP